MSHPIFLISCYEQKKDGKILSNLKSKPSTGYDIISGLVHSTKSILEKLMQVWQHGRGEKTHSTTQHRCFDFTHQLPTATLAWQSPNSIWYWSITKAKLFPTCIQKKKAVYICGSHKRAVVHNNLQEHMLQRLFVLDHYMPMERQLRQMFWRVFQLCQRWPEATWKNSVLNSAFEIPLRFKSSHATFGEAHKAFIDQSLQQQVLSAA